MQKESHSSNVPVGCSLLERVLHFSTSSPGASPSIVPKGQTFSLQALLFVDIYTGRDTTLASFTPLVKVLLEWNRQNCAFQRESGC